MVLIIKAREKGCHQPQEKASTKFSHGHASLSRFSPLTWKGAKFSIRQGSGLCSRRLSCSPTAFWNICGPATIPLPRSSSSQLSLAEFFVDGSSCSYWYFRLFFFAVKWHRLWRLCFSFNSRTNLKTWDFKSVTICVISVDSRFTCLLSGMQRKEQNTF